MGCNISRTFDEWHASYSDFIQTIAVLLCARINIASCISNIWSARVVDTEIVILYQRIIEVRTLCLEAIALARTENLCPGSSWEYNVCNVSPCSARVHYYHPLIYTLEDLQYFYSTIICWSILWNILFLILCKFGRKDFDADIQYICTKMHTMNQNIQLRHLKWILLQNFSNFKQNLKVPKCQSGRNKSIHMTVKITPRM